MDKRGIWVPAAEVEERDGAVVTGRPCGPMRAGTTPEPANELGSALFESAPKRGVHDLEDLIANDIVDGKATAAERIDELLRDQLDERRLDVVDLQEGGDRGRAGGQTPHPYPPFPLIGQPFPVRRGRRRHATRRPTGYSSLRRSLP